MLAFAPAVLALAQEPRPALDELVERAERIVVARVEAVHRLRGPELIELVPERVLYGPPAARVFAQVPDGARGIPAEGGRLIAFLEPLELLDERAARVAGDAPRGSALAPGALWRIDDDGRVGRPSGVALGDASPAAPAPALDAVLAEIAARIEASVPSIRARLGGTGPFPWTFVVNPDGSIHGNGASTSSLVPSALRALWRVVEDERFSELPRDVGRSEGPCSPSWHITVRARSGLRTVSIWGERLDGLSPIERDAAERALRVWHALPIADEPR